MSSSPAAPTLDPAVAALLKRDDHGLVAAVVQQHDSREVLMLGWMDDEALRRTLTSGRVVEVGHHADLVARDGHYAAMHAAWVSQTR